MLELVNIVKEYPVHNGKVVALKNVSLNFRRNEFVAILGPSGCGKTTMLNILGGLDRYTDGDLKINGISTKTYKDRDWDVYRNHSVGFVFQSYNLIPHQTILGNVELALTIGGINKAERVERAKIALDKVGLAGEYYKRPNQLSGGQMQRVAIARALVNDPEIILADEPTGALDTKTSVQVMDLLKEVANDRLVVMVTHNPDLADQYATRIVKLLDGEVVSDSMPYSDEEVKHDLEEYQANLKTEETNEELNDIDTKKRKKTKKKNKAKMSLFTTFRLSAQNLFTKKARTIMTSLAGAIGVIGVSMVLSMSYGVQAYIDSMQNDMLSGNPIKIEQSAYDMEALMKSLSGFVNAEIVQKEAGDGEINVDGMVEDLISKSGASNSLQVKNDIDQKYIDYLLDMPEEDSASIFFNYGLDIGNNVYTDFTRTKNPVEGETATNSMSLASIRSTYVSILKNHTNYAKYATYITSIVDNFKQSPADEDYIKEQYEVEGRVATQANEIMIVLDKDDELTDILLAQLGYYTQDEFMNLIQRGSLTNESEDNHSKYYYDETLDKDVFSLEELINKRFVYYPNDAVYSFVDSDVYKKVGSDEFLKVPKYNYLESSLESSQGFEFEVVGILTPKKTFSYGCLSSGFYYTEAFAQKFIEDNVESELVEYLDGATSFPVYKEVAGFGGKATTAMVTPTYDLDYYYYDGELTFDGNDNPILPPIIKQTQKSVMLGKSSLLGAMADMMVDGSSSAGSSGMGSIISAMSMPTLSLQQIGGNRLPESVSLYQRDFTKKDNVLAYLDRWNDYEGVITVNGVDYAKEERQRIVYTDMLTLVINMVNQFIEIVTFVLILFTALSLVVSTVMIAIITYVSVVERIKEIGVIRSLGGRKKDVSRLFTAETAIIGFASGMIGIGITYLISGILNLIINSASGGFVSAIAIFPIEYAIIMVTISVVLTLISGVFPARAAAQKDPVIALRTE